MNTSISKAARASSSNKIMSVFFRFAKKICIIGGALWMTACAVKTPLPVGPDASSQPPAAAVSQPASPVSAPDASGMRLQGKSRWVPVPWTDLPGFENDTLFEAWNAWIKSCERPGPAFAPLCPEIRRLSIASMEEQRAWMMSRLQPYRVESLSGVADGLLTSYFEPVFRASRQATTAFAVPLYQPPAGLASRKPWFSRQDIETLPEAQAALRGREIAWLEDPIDAMLLHIQGSGRLRLSEADGSQRTVRVAFAGSNEQCHSCCGAIHATSFSGKRPCPSKTPASARAVHKACHSRPVARLPSTAKAFPTARRSG
jgi:membrane-bound lytic murein transglycosylase A